jgi:hypothetical protein
MSASSHRALPAQISFRVTTEQAARLVEVAHPLSAGQYSRAIAFASAGLAPLPPGRRPLPRVQDADLLRDVLAEMGHWGGNLNQLAHLANQGTPINQASIDALHRDLDPIKRRLLQALGVLES